MPRWRPTPRSIIACPICRRRSPGCARCSRGTSALPARTSRSCGNTTEANATIVNGFELAASDEVVLWDQNHHTNNRSWGYRRARTPFVCRGVRVPAQPRCEAELIEPFVAALGPRTRVVSFSRISNISGLRPSAAALCRAIHAYRPDIFVHVDGAQGWGSTALDLAAMDCDS